MITIKGRLWKQITAKGTEYYSGTVDIEGKRYPISLWNNSYKKGDPNQPDLVIKEQNKKSIINLETEKENSNES